MKTIPLRCPVYEEGDRVLTWDGPAQVVRDLLASSTEAPSMEKALSVPVVVRLDEPSSKYPDPNEEVEVSREGLLLESTPVHKSKTPHWNGSDIAFCIRCGTSVPQDENLTSCPNCGDKSYPCLWTEQALVSVSLQELRCLCMWAERWVNAVANEHMQATMAFVFRGIVDRLLTQLPPESLLTISDEIKKYGGFIPGIRPGKQTADYLSYVLNRITLAGGLFLGAVAVLPSLVQGATGISTMTIGGTGILIVVSVVLELAKSLESQLVMRNYDRFL